MPESRPARITRIALAVVAGGALAASLAACTESTAESGEKGSPRSLAVSSTATACDLSATTAPAGTLTFRIENQGSEVTEFYLLAADGQRIVAEIENIGPGLTRQLVVDAAAGKYVTACKPGMSGEGIRADFTVTRSKDAPTVSADDQRLVDAAVSNYAVYVKDQTDQLLVRSRQFLAAYASGDDERARELYPVARTPWERIETVAESFGDLDPRTDAREADLEPGQAWTGWHRIEKDLWAPAGFTPSSTAERARLAADLRKNLTTLDTRVRSLDYTVDQIANGSRGLLEEVATGKITGEEEAWSHTDLWDFQANVDGARVGFEGLEPILKVKDPELASQLTLRFADLQRLLDAQRQGDGFRSYDRVDTAERKRLSDAVNALAEPLSRLTAAVLA